MTIVIKDLNITEIRDNINNAEYDCRLYEEFKEQRELIYGQISAPEYISIVRLMQMPNDRTACAILDTIQDMLPRYDTNVQNNLLRLAHATTRYALVYISERPEDQDKVKGLETSYRNLCNEVTRVQGPTLVPTTGDK